MKIDPNKLIRTLASEIADMLEQDTVKNPAIIGIHTGGAWVAEKLHQRIDKDLPFGTLNINFYRDDFSRRGFNPVVNSSAIDFDLENRDILLVDDVLHTGRTIRAAMNEIFDYGRPASLQLVVLADRGGRELPIEPAFCGAKFDLQPDEQLELTGPKPLRMTVVKP